MERINVANIFDEAHQSAWLQPKWYVLFVRSNQEKRVSQHLQSRSIEHFLPLFESLRQWKDRRVKLQCPLFSGYVFVRLPLVERLKALVVPNVLSFVGTTNAPSVISEEEIEWIKRGIEHGRPEPHPYLKVGTRVAVKAGAMAGLEGILIRAKNSTRVLVGLDSISRAFAVEVDCNWLEPASAKTNLQRVC